MNTLSKRKILLFFLPFLLISNCNINAMEAVQNEVLKPAIKIIGKIVAVALGALAIRKLWWDQENFAMRDLRALVDQVGASYGKSRTRDFANSRLCELAQAGTLWHRSDIENGDQPPIKLNAVHSIIQKVKIGPGQYCTQEHLREFTSALINVYGANLQHVNADGYTPVMCAVRAYLTGGFCREMPYENSPLKCFLEHFNVDADPDLYQQGHPLYGISLLDWTKNLYNGFLRDYSHGSILRSRVIKRYPEIVDKIKEQRTRRQELVAQVIDTVIQFPAVLGGGSGIIGQYLDKE